LLIEHKVQPIHLKSVDPLVRVYLAPYRSETVCRELFYLREDVPLEANVEPAVLAIQVPLKLVERELVARFELAIVFRVFLNGVVS